MSLGPQSVRGWKGGAPIGLAWVREELAPVGAVASCREWREGKRLKAWWLRCSAPGVRLRGLVPESLGFFGSSSHAQGRPNEPADRAFPSAETVLGSPALGATGAPVGKQNRAGHSSHRGHCIVG